MPDEIVRYELRDRVAVLHFDDGKANALSHAAIEALNGGLDRAEKEAGAALILGRPGRFSAGFDLATMRAGADAARGLVTAGGELFLRMLSSSQPVCAACTGHALAAGALVLLASDYRIGTPGDFKIGLNEVAIGLTLPGFAIEMARQRVARSHFVRAAVHAEMFTPQEAADVGFLDGLAPPEQLLERALEETARLAALPAAAFGGTKRDTHAAAVSLIREKLETDMAALVGLS